MASIAGELTALSRPECLALLEKESLGRVGVSIDALPAILPVNYRVLDDAIVLRTAPGTKLTAALQGAVVAFEVDNADEEAHTGWSVLVVGRARQVSEPDELERAGALGLRPWAPGSHDHFVAIAIEQISGRRIPPAA
jgi:nitroimidazol reductase NimA-like FMN-containing flavoprotein (pyridoxamine 5'-phosphate oxidase superfamily)